MNAKTGQGTALITGASSGVGAVYADRLAHRGYDLILAGRNAERLEALASKVRLIGREASVISGDLSRKADVKAIERELVTNGEITLFLNNAGQAAVAPMIESDVDKLEQMLEVNVVAFTRLAAAAAKSFAQRGRGILINLSSSIALVPEWLNGAYNGSKAYVLNLTESLQHELAGKSVQVQAVLPGAMRTELWARAGMPVEKFPSQAVMTVEAAVDAALVGLDQGELVSILSLPEREKWEQFVAARKVMQPELSLAQPAPRYTPVTTH